MGISFEWIVSYATQIVRPTEVKFVILGYKNNTNLNWLELIL